MEFTFGITTDGSPQAVNRLRGIISRIESLNIPKHETVIVGNCKELESEKIKVISFDETVKKWWITKKKNLVTENASFENIVYLHDYLIPDINWYEGWLKFGDKFVACMNAIKNIDGSRYRDWSLFPDNSSEPAKQFAGILSMENILPYEETGLSKLMYFSGAYFVAKKWVMQEIPLDESLVWGDGEDVRWSHQVRDKYEFSINPMSVVHILEKYKPNIFGFVAPEKIPILKEYLKDHPPERGYLY